MLKKFLAWVLVALSCLLFVLIAVMLFGQSSLFSGDLGFTPEYEDNQWVVRQVRPDGPMAQVGVIDGDVLKAVDGKKLSSNASEASQRAWIHSKILPNAPTMIEFIRGNGEPTVVFPISETSSLGKSLFRFVLLPLFFVTFLVAITLLLMAALESLS